jgi:hypothetical protein
VATAPARAESPLSALRRRAAGALVLVVAGLLLACGAKSTSPPPQAGAVESLAALAADPSPWLHLEAESEQRPPLFLDATPREIALGPSGRAGAGPSMPVALRSLGDAQARAVRSAITGARFAETAAIVELEAWPTMDDAGRLTWVFARWRIAGARWRWLDASMIGASPPEPAPVLPAALDPGSPSDFSLIFDDFTALPGLYDKPAFGDCVWIREADGAPLEAWLPTAEMAERGARAREIPPNGGEARSCLVLPQPARVDGRPATFVLRVGEGGTTWPPEIAWLPAPDRPAPAPASAPAIPAWPTEFGARFRSDVEILSGARDAVFPKSGRTVRFAAKNSADPKSQLDLLVDYLEERYAALGLETRRERFSWRGIPQSNLIAIIPGTAPDASARPILMADHVDTAYCEDAYGKTHERISAPGADDNATATATLLRAAELLSGTKPARDVWLVHLTGEEFPADDLGARHLLGETLAARQDLGGLVLMDMIGYRDAGDRVFQMSVGDSAGSREIAAVALAASAGQSGLDPALRMPYEDESYLYNTDGIVFSQMGYPVILLNEHLNRVHNLMRAGYHDTTDTIDRIDWEYATAIGKIAIETTARLAATR